MNKTVLRQMILGFVYLFFYSFTFSFAFGLAVGAVSILNRLLSEGGTRIQYRYAKSCIKYVFGKYLEVLIYDTHLIPIFCLT